MKQRFPNARWTDLSGLIDGLRLVKSAAEQAWLRQAAVVSDAGASAAIAAIGSGASERHVAAECGRAMIEAGGTFPGFGPFIRSTARLGEEHGTWTDHRFGAGESVFLDAGRHPMRQVIKHELTVVVGVDYVLRSLLAPRPRSRRTSAHPSCSG